MSEVGVEIADRFLDNIDRAFVMLADMPRMGPSLGSIDPELAELRKWKVGDFPQVMIFYEPREFGISVVRVIHAAQDWWRLADI